MDCIESFFFPRHFIAIPFLHLQRISHDTESNSQALFVIRLKRAKLLREPKHSRIIKWHYTKLAFREITETLKTERVPHNSGKIINCSITGPRFNRIERDVGITRLLHHDIYLSSVLLIITRATSTLLADTWKRTRKWRTRESSEVIREKPARPSAPVCRLPVAT